MASVQPSATEDGSPRARVPLCARVERLSIGRHRTWPRRGRCHRSRRRCRSRRSRRLAATGRQRFAPVHTDTPGSARPVATPPLSPHRGGATQAGIRPRSTPTSPRLTTTTAAGPAADRSRRHPGRPGNEFPATVQERTDRLPGPPAEPPTAKHPAEARVSARCRNCVKYRPLRTITSPGSSPSFPPTVDPRPHGLPDLRRGGPDLRRAGPAPAVRCGHLRQRTATYSPSGPHSAPHRGLPLDELRVRDPGPARRAELGTDHVRAIGSGLHAAAMRGSAPPSQVNHFRKTSNNAKGHRTGRHRSGTGFSCPGAQDAVPRSRSGRRAADALDLNNVARGPDLSARRERGTAGYGQPCRPNVSPRRNTPRAHQR